jgi:uncharacterized membrane protein (UPF0127 family)
MTGTPLRIAHARTFGARLGGLLARPPLRDDEALYLAPCASVHTFFMRYAIDVAFVDRAGRVLKVVTLAPWRAAGCVGAHAALELRAGQARCRGLAPGVTVDIDTGDFA